jgi:hypothetical protein
MAQAATHSGHDPDRVSFVAALRITRADHRPPGRLSPLTNTAATAPAGCTSSTACSAGSTPPGNDDPTPG